jgi:hypothetical protein
MFRPIAQRNIAPSAEHPTHDVYGFDLATQPTARPFRFWQSTGGGHGDSGGAIELGLQELETWPGDWRLHLERAGCSWVIGLIEEARKGCPLEQLIAAISMTHLPATEGG